MGVDLVVEHLEQIDRLAAAYARARGLDVDDTIGEARLAAVAAARRYDPHRGPAGPWLVWAARHGLIDQARHRRRHAPAAPIRLDHPAEAGQAEPLGERIPDPTVDVEDQALTELLVDELGAAIQPVLDRIVVGPPRYRTMIRTLLDGLAAGDTKTAVAARAGVHPSEISRLLAWLRSWLDPDTLRAAA